MPREMAAAGIELAAPPSHQIAPARALRLRGSPGIPHDERADVRQYFGPALRVELGYVALALSRLMIGERHLRDSTLTYAAELP
jgi:hypothetical protein